MSVKFAKSVNVQRSYGKHTLLVELGLVMWATSRTQWLFFGRNIGQLTPKITYFHYLRKKILDQSIQKTVYLILKKVALHVLRLAPIAGPVMYTTRSTCRGYSVIP